MVAPPLFRQRSRAQFEGDLQPKGATSIVGRKKMPLPTLAVLSLSVALVACSRREPSSGLRGTSPPHEGRIKGAASDAASANLTNALGQSNAHTSDVSDASAEPPARAEKSWITKDDARELLFGNDSPSGCDQDGGLNDDAIACMLRTGYQADPRAASIAVDMYNRGWFAGLEREQDFDGGYRGIIHLVPTHPIGNDRRHLEWTQSALTDFEKFFTALTAGASIPYRYTSVTLSYFRSARVRTPNAFAHGWSVSYNVAGSLLHSEEAVRELLFHEIFHLNDFAHSDWSTRTLGDLFNGIKKKCGTKAACLAPLSPNKTMVRGGTYYAFQPGNGVEEYAAELAIRYYTEQRAKLFGLTPVPAFKCGPPENARAWTAIVNEFFAGIDRTDSCGT